MTEKNVYSPEELELFTSLESDVEEGNYTPISTEKLQEQKKLYRQIAENTIDKKTRKKSINIRIYEDDIEKIKAQALEQGLPYQTLISSIIHRLALKQL